MSFIHNDYLSHIYPSKLNAKSINKISNLNCNDIVRFVRK